MLHRLPETADRTALLLLQALLLVSACLPLHAQHVAEYLVLESEDGERIEGRIDWDRGVLIAYGGAVAPAVAADPARQRLLGLRAARAAAFRSLRALIGQVRIDAGTTVGDAMAASELTRTLAGDLVDEARVLSGSQQESGRLYRIALQLELFGRFADIVLPERLFDRPAPPSLTDPRDTFAASYADDSASSYADDSASSYADDSASSYADDSASSSADDSASSSADYPDLFPAPANVAPPRPYTGLLVDARGLDLRPSLAPRVLTEEDLVVYSAAFADRFHVVQTGVTGYSDNFYRARLSDRLGGPEGRPLIVTALGMSGHPYATDLVLSREDGFRVAAADAGGDFLSRCRVVFVIGPKPVFAEPGFLDPFYSEPADSGLFIGEGDPDLPGEIGLPDRADSSYFLERDDHDLPGEISFPDRADSSYFLERKDHDLPGETGTDRRQE
jgi:hypothetical protein